MFRRILLVVVALAACGDDGSNRHLADAPPLPDMEIDAPIDAPITPPQDLELGLVTSGNGTGRISSSPDGIDCGATCTASFEEGTMVTLTAEPDESSLFTGWGGACSGTSPVCEVTITAATSVTATFTLKTYTVTVTKNGGGDGTVAGNGINCGTGADCSTTVDHGTAISLTATPASLNIFVGWGGACDGNGTCDLTVTEDVDITAGFALDELALIVTKGGNGDGTITSSPAGISCPGTCNFVFTANQMVTLTAAPAASSTFTGWSSPCSGTGSCVVTMDAAKTVTGTFALKRYALDVTKMNSTGTGTVTSDPAGIACGADCTETYDHGTTVTLTAAASAASTFAGWSGGGCSGSSTCVVTLAAATTVNAQFTINSYTLSTSVTGMGSISSAPAGIACPGDCSQSYTHGTNVSLTPTAATGYTFAGWGGECNGTGACTVAMTQARNVTATFTINSYPLDVDIVGSGTVTASPQIACPGDCTGTYTHDTVVTLTRSASTGYSFTGWSGACTGTGACMVTMDQARNVTATFTINSYALNVSFPAANTGTGTVTASPQIACPGDCTGTYTHDTVVSLTQTPNGDSNFTGWGGACSNTGACNVTMDAMKSVTASYTLKTYDLNVSITGTGTVNAAPQIGCPTDCVGTYSHGTMVSLTQSAGSGYRFTAWGGSCSGNGACVVPMNQMRDVTATFTRIFTLDVSIAGSTGTVSSVPAGISCGADCEEDYLTGTSVTLTAMPSGGATFASWSGAPGCSTSSTCTVTMSQARDVIATFDPPMFMLTAALAGDGFGRITAAGITCDNTMGAPGPDCTQTLVQGSMITLTAAPRQNLAAQASTFRGWTGCTSSSGTTCNVTMDAVKTVRATFDLAPNLMFVTSTAHEMLGAGWMRTAQAICDNAATALTGEGPEQNSKWVPWMSGYDYTSMPIGGVLVNAATRLQGISGWVRTDGRPFLNRIEDINDDQIVYPPRIDQNRNDVGPNAQVWTGTNDAGMHSGSSCGGSLQGVNASWWTPNDKATLGLSSANSAEFTRFTNSGSCGGARRLYCFGADRKASITVTPARGRLAFTTSTPFTPVGGLDEADKHCRNEAMDAGISTYPRFRALLATTTQSAMSRFTVDPNNEPWVRVGDLQPLTRTDAEMRSPQLTTLTVAPNATAAGQRVGNVEIWTGAASLMSEAPNASATCNNWTSTQGKASGGLAFDTGVSTYWFGPFTNGYDCSVPRRLVCMENLQ